MESDELEISRFTPKQGGGSMVQESAEASRGRRLLQLWTRQQKNDLPFEQAECSCGECAGCRFRRERVTSRVEVDLDVHSAVPWPR